MYTCNNHIACKPPIDQPKAAPKPGAFVTTGGEGLMELEVLWDNHNAFLWRPAPTQPALRAGTRIWIAARPANSFQVLEVGGQRLVLVDATKVVLVKDPAELPIADQTDETPKCKHCDNFIEMCGACHRPRSR